MRRSIVAGSLCFVFACGGGNDTSGTPDGSTGPADAPPLTGDKYSVSFGPIMVEPGFENTQCVTVRLSNTGEIKVHQMHNVLTRGSHHLIVYRDDMSTEERPAPYDCTPFTGALNLSGMAAPVMITQKDDDALTLPDKVAYTFKPGQMIRLEMHYINSTEAPIEISATSDFYAVDPSSIDHEANILFIGSPDIDIPAHSTATLEQFFRPDAAQLDLTGTKFFAITGHTHQYGTDMQVEIAESEMGARTSVYAPAPFEWAEPTTQGHAPPFDGPTDFGGFHFRCAYNNTSDQRVEFGESANDEMCFFWAYYYPSRGSHVCVHTNYQGLDIDICCPEAGSLCSMLEDQF